MHHHPIVETYAALGVVSFAIKTAPVPKNEWARWFMGVLNFIALNWERGVTHFEQPKGENQ